MLEGVKSWSEEFFDKEDGVHGKLGGEKAKAILKANLPKTKYLSDLHNPNIKLKRPGGEPCPITHDCSFIPHPFRPTT